MNAIVAKIVRDKTALKMHIFFATVLVLILSALISFAC